MLVMTNFTPQNEVSVPMPLKVPRPMLGMTKQGFVTSIGKSTCQKLNGRVAEGQDAWCMLPLIFFYADFLWRAARTFSTCVP
jgi:hypothetical protein